MSAFWSKFKASFLLNFHSGNPWLHTGIFVFVLSILCLITNTSFHVMGVDISEFVSLFYGLAPLLLRDLGGVLLSSYAFFLGALVLFLGPEFLDWKKGERLQPIRIYSILIAVLFLLFCHSVAKYPQVYGEFFYYRHTWALGFLYFITDHFPPWVFTSLLGIFLGLQVGRSFFSLWQTKQYRSLIEYLVFIILFYLFHLSGLFLGILALCFLYSKDFLLVTSAIVSKDPSAIGETGSWKITGVFRSKKDLIVVSVLLFAFGISIFVHHDFQKGPSSPQFSIAKKSKEFNVLILAADSIREDKLGFVKGEKDLTPNIDSLAKDSVVFLDHHTTIPRTFPAWADLLTGTYSFEHGIQDMFPDKEDRSKLGISIPTLPSFLSETHRTAVVSSFAGDIFPRANWGFEEVYAPNFSAETLTQQRTIESQVFFLPVLTGSFFGGGEYLSSVRSLPTLGDDSRILSDLDPIFQKKEKPFFAVYFSSVTHFPYSPPYPFYKEGTDPKYYGPSKYFRFVDPSNSEKPDTREREQIRAVYQASLKSFDHAVGEIISRLKEKGLYDKTLILLTSDHGESLFEEDHSHGHGEHLRGEGVTKVPLIIKFPKDFAGPRIGSFKGITSSLDIFPTILSILETDEKPHLAGKDLSSRPGTEYWPENRAVYSETGIWFSDRGNHFFQKDRIRYPNILELHTIDPLDGNSVTVSDPYAKETVLFSKHRMLQDRNRKLIYVPGPEGVKYFCYDREKDPWNTRPLLNGACADLRSRLEDLLLRSGKWKKAGEYFLHGKA
ncbi:sulfatase [Leptospira semungkisensis]|uniref:Sulfatase n=1 Tax=Leptospira semungkisensis TaxID=2484985 RepID=A0A4R9G0I5_9LEPT|nr:sulfatase-like hydrolase/transferase [Leptospira semungkisensis]TGK04882.1 sulfatase [Leptospira semungkisensis]